MIVYTYASLSLYGSTGCAHDFVRVNLDKTRLSQITTLFIVAHKTVFRSPSDLSLIVCNIIHFNIRIIYFFKLKYLFRCGFYLCYEQHVLKKT